MSEVSMQLEKITPQRAERMLRHNTHNRTLRPETVRDYARQMQTGQWHLNGATVAFDRDGNLLDGQHRLLAIVEAGVTVELWVGRGFDGSAQDTTDVGRRRTAGDVLGLHGLASGNKLSAVVRMVHKWDEGQRSMYGFNGARDQLSAAEVLRIVERDELYAEAVHQADQPGLRRLGVARVSGTLFVLTARLDPDRAMTFFDKLASGAGLDEGSPILTLRRYWARLGQQTARKVGGGIYLMAGVRCWNAVAAGRDLHQIAYKTTDIPELATPRRLKALPEEEEAAS